MRSIPSVLAVHAEEAAFLWLLRDGAVRAPHYKLWELARLDERVDAHLEGLRIAGDAGWQLALEELEAHPEPGETFAAGVLAFESGNQGCIGRVLAAGAATPQNGRGVISALGWLPEAVASEHVKYLLLAESPVHRRFGVGGAAIRRQPLGQHLEPALRDSDPALRARALKAVGELAAAACVSIAARRVTDPDPRCRFYACWSVLRLQADPAALGELQSLIQQEGGPRRREGISLVVRRMALPQAQRWLEALGMLPGGERFALIGFGQLGDPAAVPKLIEASKSPPLARVAGEAFEMITGADIAYEDLDARPPQDFQAGPTENPEDENVDLDPDGNLPWPDPDKLKAWWAKNQSRFPRGTRHLVGKPVTPDWCRELVKIGRQRQRTAAALELAIYEPNKPLLNVSIPGFRQKAMLISPIKGSQAR
jgi:uncharacterized protein (TIGR02270 family)